MTTCRLEECSGAVHGRGLCNKHLKRLRNTGSVLGYRANPDRRLWDNVTVEGDCWLWSAGLNRDGYGRLSFGGKRWLAHRLAYSLLVGEIEDGMTLDHLCRVRACVNPDHLEPVTNAENVLRGYGTSAANARKTHCIRGHEFTAENTYEPPHRPGNRWCRTCRATAYGPSEAA